jgi:Predicted nucleotide-binding protein containing TIR-like domain
MPRGRQAGKKNRNYPPLRLSESVKVARAIQDEASGMSVSRLTLAQLLNSTPTSRVFRELVASSRFYGLTNGGINAEEFSLTELGERATGADEDEQVAALKAAVMNVPPFALFFASMKGKKMPSAGPFQEFLVREAAVPTDRAEEAAAHIAADAEAAGLVRKVGNGIWVDLDGVPAPAAQGEDEGDGEPEHAGDDVASQDDGVTGDEVEQDVAAGRGGPDQPIGRSGRETSSEPRKVFIAHGKNRTPLEQLKKALDQFKVKYAVAVDEANRGRPISKKVADLMEEECSSGIFIFTADERFLREQEDGTTEEVWRPSENVVYELGAASILYENRIVIFKESGVSFPSDFSDLGYIEFEKDQLVAEIGNLFSELVGLDILEVRAKG